MDMFLLLSILGTTVISKVCFVVSNYAHFDRAYVPRVCNNLVSTIETAVAKKYKSYEMITMKVGYYELRNHTLKRLQI